VRGKLRFAVRTLAGKPLPFAKRLAAKKGGARKQRFGFYDYIFPVQAKHSYGDGLGAGRGHQGQDVAAPCGSKLVAAQGGTVQVNAYQAEGAGYYLVIDTVGGEVDHVYMHLVSAPQLPVGTPVATGQVIGLVGTTGRSTGCHLHFEMWSGPGWYEGGAVLDPSPYLRAWDKYS
jgi:murein DD-endopeptidase MepM/ murein hydrolase activator NlpD